MSVRVRAKLPKGEANGLASWEAKLLHSIYESRTGRLTLPFEEDDED